MMRVERAEAAVLGDVGDVEVVDGGEVNPLAVEGDAVHAGAARDGLHLVGAAVAVGVADQHDVADAAPRGVEIAAGRDREHARVDEVAGEDGDGEAFGGTDHAGELGVVAGRELLGLEDRAGDRDVGIGADLALGLGGDG